MTGSVLPGQVAFHSISKTITVGLQTRLLCIPKKPCLRCKEALFGGQRSLVFNAGVLTSSFVAWIVRLPLDFHSASSLFRSAIFCIVAEIMFKYCENGIGWVISAGNDK